MNRRSVVVPVGVMVAVALAGCARQEKEGILVVTTINVANGTTLPGTLGVIEEGGLYVPAADPALGPSSFRYGGQAGESGSFSILLPAGSKGVHVFTDGYHCAAGSINIEPNQDEEEAFQSLELSVRRIAEDTARPLVSEIAIAPTVVEAGGEVVISAQVTAAPDDPLSNQVLLVHPAEAFAAAMDPPAESVPGEGSRDGLWSKTLAAPSEPGVYVYSLVAASQACVTADVQTVTLIVD